MKRLTLMIIPDGTNSTRQVQVPTIFVKLCVLASLAFCGVAGFFVFDYMQLRAIRGHYSTVSNENEGLKGEARILSQNLEEVKKSLRRVQDYTSKLTEITKVKAKKVNKKTGIGPLNDEEYQAAQIQPEIASSSSFLPIGVSMDGLVFKPVFSRLASLGEEANNQALELQHLLSTLSQQKSLISSIPSLTPVNGWIASGYGTRISPFTGKRTPHKGIDIAAPTGTPILAPADGVVIFSGAKAGFGNFIMVAHGYGVVTRYGHNHQNLVQPGQKVARGEQIATVGATGRTTGPHLHYEVWVNGNTKNPKKYILDMDEFQVY